MLLMGFSTHVLRLMPVLTLHKSTITIDYAEMIVMLMTSSVGPAAISNIVKKRRVASWTKKALSYLQLQICKKKESSNGNDLF